MENTKHPESTIYVPEATPLSLPLPALRMLMHSFTDLYPSSCRLCSSCSCAWLVDACMGYTAVGLFRCLL